tara:strand:+ start:602 stop:1651 length:1050 start_codon:yes stop_codon:yes gene_type:complete
MAFSGDPTNVNVHSGGTGKNSYPIADQFVPEVWGRAILDVFQQTIMMDNLGVDLSTDVSQAGDVIHLPHIGVPALQAVTHGEEIAADITGSGSETQTDLTIDQYNVSSVYVPDITRVQSSYDLMSVYVKQLAYANARGFDNYMHYQVAKNFETLLSSDTGVVGADANLSMHVLMTSSALSQENLTSLMALILGETGSTEGWHLVLSTDTYASLNALTSYSQGTQSAPLGGDFGRTGNAGSILGMPVWVAQSPYMGSANSGATVTADEAKGILQVTTLDDSGTNNDDIVYGYAIHESALYYAFSRQAKITASYRHAYLSTLVTCESAYGAAIRNTDADGNRRVFALVDYE